MKKFNLLLLATLSTYGFSDTLLHVGNLIDVDTGEINKAITITVAQNKIKSISKGYAKANALMCRRLL